METQPEKRVEKRPEKHLRTPIPGRATGTRFFWRYGKTSRYNQLFIKKSSEYLSNGNSPSVSIQIVGMVRLPESGRPIIRTP